MALFLKSIFNKSKPNILDSLTGLNEVEEVTDYCFFDAEGNVVEMVSRYGNDKSLFSYLGKEVARISLLLDSFAKRSGSVTKFCHIQCYSGGILIWNFDGSFLMVLLSGTRRISTVRMTVNVFRGKASADKHFEKYFRGPDPPTANLWENDRELTQCMQSIFGTQTTEEGS